MTDSSRPGRWARYLAYGPLTDAPRADQSKIAKPIQRGRAVTDDRLVAQALAYARFRVRVWVVFGLIFLSVAAVQAVTAAFGSVSLPILNAVTSGAALLSSICWFWMADLCRRGARATAQAYAGGQR